MSIAYWCVLLAGLLPFLTIAPVKATRSYNNATPRDWENKLDGFRRRGVAAHLNAFEAFPLFAAAVVIADLKGMPQDPIDTLAVIFVAMRIAHAACYYANLASLRTIVWTLGLLTTVAIFTMPAWLF